VQRSLAGGSWQDLVVLPVDATSFDDTSVQPGTDVAYRVQVLDANGRDSDFSMAPGPIHSYPNLPSTPAISSVTASGADSLTIAWSNLLAAADAEVSSYRLERASLSGGPYTTIASLLKASTSFDDTGLTPGTLYYYRLYAGNASGDSEPSPEASGATRTLDLAAPQNLTLTHAGDLNYTLSWGGLPAVPGIQAVVEQQVDGQQGFTTVATLPGAGPFNFEQVNPGHYSFRVKFVGGNSESPYTSINGFANLANFIGIQASTIFLPMITR
jgi:hypothetical protein